MSKLSKIIAGKKYEINGEEFEFTSIELDDESAPILEGTDLPMLERINMTKKLIRRMVKEAVPDATEEELNKINRLKTLFPLMDAFYDVNGLLDEKNVARVKRMEKIKNAIEKGQQSQQPKTESTKQVPIK